MKTRGAGSAAAMAISPTTFPNRCSANTPGSGARATTHRIERHGQRQYPRRAFRTNPSTEPGKCRQKAELDPLGHAHFAWRIEHLVERVTARARDWAPDYEVEHVQYQCQRRIEQWRHEHCDDQRNYEVDRSADERDPPRCASVTGNRIEKAFPFSGRPCGPPRVCCHALSLYPVRKMAQTAAKHASRNTTIMQKLTTMLTSETP